MDIRCPQCETLYEFDESQLDSGSATLKCRKCQHMFRLGENSQPSREDTRRWMARAPGDGEILYFEGFEKLHDWVVDGRVDQRWEISRTGDRWTRLGDVGEFRPIFQAVDDAAAVQGESGVSRSGSAAADREQSDSRDEKGTLDQFEGVDRSNASAGRDGATAARPKRSSTEASPPETIDESRPPSDRQSDVSVPDDSVDGRNIEQPNDQREPRRRTRSPAQQQTTPGASSPAASSGELPPEPDPPAERSSAAGSGERAAADPGSGERQVHLESDQFGSADEAPSAEGTGDTSGGDEWAFEEESSEFGETTDVVDEDLTYQSSGPGGTTWAIVAVVVLGGGAALLWTFQRERVRGWLDALSGSDQPAAEETATEPSDDSNDEKESPTIDEARIDVVSALSRASGAASTKGKTFVGSARETAAEGIRDAIDSARDRAKSEAQGSSSGARGGDVTSLLSAAQEALQNGNTSRAERLYQQVLARDPQNPSALTGIGWAKLNQGAARAARDKFADARRVAPSFGDAYIGLGQANRRIGNLQESLSNYRTYLDKFPGGSKASIARHNKKELEKQLGVN